MALRVVPLALKFKNCRPLDRYNMTAVSSVDVSCTSYAPRDALTHRRYCPCAALHKKVRQTDKFFRSSLHSCKATVQRTERESDRLPSSAQGYDETHCTLPPPTCLHGVWDSLYDTASSTDQLHGADVNWKGC